MRIRWYYLAATKLTSPRSGRRRLDVSLNSEKQYGMFGWKEFHRNRKDILAEFDRAKEYGSSRPVRTEHGITAEAELRRWLSSYLPGRFGVTSGYIIPDLVVGSYDLYHFDVIIYDVLASPILWVDGNRDDSDQGKKRAIPAKYVRSVFEVKATLSAESAKEAVTKLKQLNGLAPYLPAGFSCNTLFYDLDVKFVEKPNILPYLIPDAPIIGYWGGVILRCLLDEEMTGLMHLFPKEQNPSSDIVSTPLARRLDSLEIEGDGKGGALIKTGGAGIMAFSDGKTWHYAKLYGPTVYGPTCGLSLNWSNNSFARFALDLLSRLDGIPPQMNRGYVFGQVFDAL
jgi:hypothetical protein